MKRKFLILIITAVSCFLAASENTKPFKNQDFYKTFKQGEVQQELLDLKKLLVNHKYSQIIIYCDHKINEDGSDVQLFRLCAMQSLNNTDDCDFTKTFFNNNRYNNYVKKERKLQISSISTLGYPINSINTEEVIQSTLDNLFCAFYLWCKQHPKSAKYLVDHPASTDGYSGITSLLLNQLIYLQ
jgi:hypothetical protein